MHGENQSVDLNITYGSACNMHCRYCLQAPDSNAKKGDIDEFIAGLRKYLAQNKKTVKGIAHWGGETLLYLPRIKKVIEAFPEAKNNRISTNGLLIDEKYVEYANSVPTIHTCLSIHDEPISDDNYRNLAKLKKCSIAGVFFKGVTSAEYYRPVWEKIYQLTGRYVPLGIIFEKAAGGCSPDCYLTQDDIIKYFEDFLGNIYPKACEGDEFCKRVICTFLYDCRARIKQPSAPRCCSDHLLSLDTMGNIVACHHNDTANNLLGNIFKKTIPIGKAPEYNKYFKSEKCQQCEALPLCKGGCFLSNNHDVECFAEIWKWRIFNVLEYKNRKYGLRDNDL